jgi:hypothetical protein
MVGGIMKKLGIYFLLFSFVTPCFAAKQEQGYLVSTELIFKDSKGTVATKSTEILAKDMNMWTALNQAEKGIVLLGKKSPDEKGTFKMEFMVIDTTQKPMQISMPTIVTQLGQEAEISSNQTDDDGKVVESVGIKFLAKSVDYQSEK